MAKSLNNNLKKAKAGKNDEFYTVFDYIQKDIEERKVLLQWDHSKDNPPVPLLKEKYAAERKKAKTKTRKMIS